MSLSSIRDLPCDLFPNLQNEENKMNFTEQLRNLNTEARKGLSTMPDAEWEGIRDKYSLTRLPGL